MILNQLIGNLAVVKTIGNLEIQIDQIELNSSLIGKNGLFVAIHGLKTDGHNYIDAAIKNGAIAIVCEIIPEKTEESISYIQVSNSRKTLALIAKQFYSTTDDRLRKIAVTGTNGKTSTAYFIRQLLTIMGHKCGMIGTIEYNNGSASTVASHTTPEIHIIQRLFSEMRQNNCEFCVMEVSSHGLALNRLDEIIFERAVFTNLSQDHLDFHSDMEDYFHAKELLFSQHLNGVAVLNFDDTYAKRIKYEPQISYSLTELSDLRISSFHLNTESSQFTVSFKGKYYNFETSILGRYNLYNLLAAISVLLSFDFSYESIQHAIGKLKPVPGRMETIPFKKAVAIIDYAHTPDALLNVLKTSRDFCNGRLVCVFGCGGDRDKNKRPKMAQAAEEHADFIFVTSDNPRSENPETIIDDIVHGFNKNTYYERYSDRKTAINAALEFAQANDVVVIAGKGHEPYQEINGVRHHFDDREIVREWGAAHAH